MACRIKIATAYIGCENLGDCVIKDTAEYIIRKLLKEQGLSEAAELLPVNIGASEGQLKKSSPFAIATTVLGRILKGIAERPFFYSAFPHVAEDLIRKAWHLTWHYRYYRNEERPKLEDEGLGMIIFDGGGLVKFHKQYFHLLLDDITAIAMRRGIPVLINAVGVEGYSDEHPGCRILKKALNRSCIRYVSVRDDYDLYRESFAVNKEIRVIPTCDPAFWTAETYGVKKAPVKGRIGINVIRPNIYGQYLYEVEKESLDELYHGLLTRLLKEGCEPVLFSNGVSGDTEYARQLLKKYPELKGKVKICVPKTPKELIRLIAHFERYVAVRLHASIVGTVLGIPNISLVWNTKQILFGEQVGLPENYLCREDFKAETVHERLFAAVPYEIDQEYKMSVYTGLKEAVADCLKEEKH